MMTNKCSRLIAYRWFMTDAYQTCCFQLKIYPFLLVDTENCFSFETECDFMLSYWSSLGIVLRATKTFSVSSWKVHFPLWYCTLLCEDLGWRPFNVLIIHQQITKYNLRQLVLSEIMDTGISAREDMEYASLEFQM